MVNCLAVLWKDCASISAAISIAHGKPRQIQARAAAGNLVVRNANDYMRFTHNHFGSSYSNINAIAQWKFKPISKRHRIEIFTIDIHSRDCPGEKVKHRPMNIALANNLPNGIKLDYFLIKDIHFYTMILCIFIGESL